MGVANTKCPECKREGKEPEVSPRLAHYYKNVLYCHNCQQYFSTEERANIK